MIEGVVLTALGVLVALLGLVFAFFRWKDTRETKSAEAWRSAIIHLKETEQARAAMLDQYSRLLEAQGHAIRMVAAADVGPEIRAIVAIARIQKSLEGSLAKIRDMSERATRVMDRRSWIPLSPADVMGVTTMAEVSAKDATQAREQLRELIATTLAHAEDILRGEDSRQHDAAKEVIRLLR